MKFLRRRRTGEAEFGNRAGGLLAAGVAAALALGCKKPPPPTVLPVVRVVKAQPRSVAQTLEWLATLDGSTNAEIRPRVEGYVRSVNYREGLVVARGTPLFTIDSRPLAAALLKARGEHERAIAELNKARADVTRYTPLVAARALSEQELANAQAEERIASANIRAAKGVLEVAALNLEWAEVASPITGIAGIAQTRVGTLVNPTQVLTVVSTVDPIRASFHVSERTYLRAAEVFNHINDPKYADRRYLELILVEGHIHPARAQQATVDRQIDPTTGTLLIQALFPNPDNVLRPGLFARVRVHTGRQAALILLPQRAVQQVQGLFQVAVVGDDQRVQVRTVTPGQTVGSEQAIEEGLRTGERVIIEGQQNVQPGQRVEVQEVPEVAAPPGGDGGGSAPAVAGGG